MSTTFQIVTEACVYVSSRRELKFEATIEKAQKLVQGKSKAESDNRSGSYPLTTYSSSTFYALHRGIAEKWLFRDGFVKLFRDKSKSLRFVCTFNLDQDLRFYLDENGHIQLPLTRLREPGF